MNTGIDINDHQVMMGLSNACFLKKSAVQSSMKLAGPLQTSTGSSMSEGIRHSVASKPSLCSDHLLGRACADLMGPNKVESFTGRRYVLVVRDDFSHFTWAHPIRHKRDTPRAFERSLAGVVSEGIAECICHYSGLEFRGEAFAYICDQNRIHKEFTGANLPASNGVVDRAIKIGDAVQKAARIQASFLFAQAGASKGTENL